MVLRLVLAMEMAWELPKEVEKAVQKVVELVQMMVCRLVWGKGGTSVLQMVASLDVPRVAAMDWVLVLW